MDQAKQPNDKGWQIIIMGEGVKLTNYKDGGGGGGISIQCHKNLTSHSVPVIPAGQVHVYSPTPSKQVAPSVH